jgi:hypothetical protein
LELERHRKTDVSQRNVAALQRQAAANEMMTALPRGCRAALPKACRAKTPCRVSVVAVTVRAAGASGTWDIYSQIASRLKSLQARDSADHCRHDDRKVSCERLGGCQGRPGGRGPPREENCSSDFCSEEKESLCHNPLGPWDVFYGVWGWSLVCGSLRVAGL